MLLVLLSTNFLHLCRSPIVVQPPSIVYFGFYFYCFYFYGFCGWILVFVGDHFYRDFVMFVAVPISHQLLQGGCKVVLSLSKSMPTSQPLQRDFVNLDRVENSAKGHAPEQHRFGSKSALCGQILGFVQGK